MSAHCQDAVRAHEPILRAGARVTDGGAMMAGSERLLKTAEVVKRGFIWVWLFWSDTRERVLMRAVPLPGRTVWH